MLIRRPKTEDIIELNQFFKTVIIDTFAKEGLSDLHDVIESEYEEKKKFLMSDLNSNGQSHYFLIALLNDNIIGTIAYGPSNELITSCTNGELKDLVEIGTVFVHPDYQRSGVGTELTTQMLLTLKKKGIETFCLDSGYTNAQKVWKKKFGEPDYLLKDYWSEGFHHMIWIVTI